MPAPPVQPVSISLSLLSPGFRQTSVVNSIVAEDPQIRDFAGILVYSLSKQPGIHLVISVSGDHRSR
jgi:hypothetical protein